MGTDGSRPNVSDHRGETHHRGVTLVLVLAWLIVAGCGDPHDASPELDAPAAAGDGSRADAPPKRPVESAESSERAAELAIGDPNPGLRIAKWVRGEPVEPPLRDKVHVVEFWATWCGPCRIGMPHLSSLQTQYADEVTFIGVTREDESTVEDFLSEQGPGGNTWDEVIEYRLALDEGDWTNAAYMQAAGRNGIPCAFLIGRDGIIEWIGHPGRLDGPLQQVVAGNWDRQAAIAEYRRLERLQEVARELSPLIRAEDWDGVFALLDTLEAETGKFPLLLDYRLRLLESAQRDEEASRVRRELVDVAWDDPITLDHMAWRTALSGKGRDLQLALKAARRASELKDDQDASTLETVARCHLELGQLDEAVAWQRRAVEASGGQAPVEANLQRYLEAKERAEPSPADPRGEDPSANEPAEKESAQSESARSE
jgi:thiol-disulfide isomerase/thioredoxin